MAFKHHLVPLIRIDSPEVVKPSSEASICMSCDIEDKHCSFRCKRYLEKLAELKRNKNELKHRQG